ncbi:hypothetical protein [Pendulispora albinea]|uniref:PI3K/PI4K catalytic domain-containing protein n=1 Tax=Pendulispora albinea TaxID=2741071 RepID=A0ABZ2M2R4_9BACT
MTGVRVPRGGGCRPSLVALMLLLAACGKDARKSESATEGAPAAQSGAAHAPNAPPAAGEAQDAGVAARNGEEMRAGANPNEGTFAGATPKAIKSIGHTSVVFKVDFSNGQRAAWKPRSKRGKTRYRGEVAAYRLAQELGLHYNVPIAFPIRIAREDLNKAAQGKDSALLEAELLGEPDGSVRGALIPWIPKLEFFPIESEKTRAEWERWLFSGADIPEKDRVIAGDISTVIAFDLITGNWDRFSGGNMGANGPGGHLLFIDNDGAFFDPVPPGPLARQTALLQRTERFSKSFVEALRKLDAGALARAIGDESPGEPLLSPAVLQGVFARRTAVLAAIDKKIAAHGEPAVLFFP